MKRIPGWLAISEIVATVFVVLTMLAILIYAPFWTLGGLGRKRRRPAERAMRIWPLVAALSLITVVIVVIAADGDAIERLGNLTLWSASIFPATVVFAIAAVASAVAWWRTPAGSARPGIRRFSTIVASALLIAAAYLAYWGVIGLRTWS